MSPDRTPARPAHLRFSPKLRLANLWPVLLGLTLLAAMAHLSLPRVLGRASADRLLAASRFLAPGFAELGAGDPAALQRRLAAMAPEGPFRFTAIALDGTVLADTTRDLDGVAQLESHRERAEVLTAMARGEGTAVRRSASTGVLTAYAARLLTAADGSRWVLRVARPIEEIGALRALLWWSTALAALAALAVVLLLSRWLSRSLFAPLAGLTDAAQTIGEGNYHPAIPLPEEPELASLGHALARIAERAEAQIAQARAERDHLRTVVESLGDGVLVTDGAGRAEIANAVFLRQFGSSGPVAGQSLRELVRHPALTALVEQVLAEGGRERQELELHDTDRRHLDLLATSLGEGQGAVVVARDVTAAARLDRTRRDFVANVSHELKTPLAAIQGAAETLQEAVGDDPAAASRFVERILHHCRRLERLVADLLALSRLETAERPRELAPVALAPLAARVLESLAPLATERQVALRLESEGEPVVEGESDVLERMLSNLVENGIRYNRPDGEVAVRVAARPGGATVEVRDTGVGIARAALPRVFERFFRVDTGRTRREGGSGRGLARGKHAVLAHAGRRAAPSQPGSGSTFRIDLPAHLAATAR
ncbi:MAG: PAS domain-containing protein [Thermoanaerobaculia bacterium]|nr:PAS domain-containing protein [Thermoanaerobaculia bacterium]